MSQKQFKGFPRQVGDFQLNEKQRMNSRKTNLNKLVLISSAAKRKQCGRMKLFAEGGREKTLQMLLENSFPIPGKISDSLPALGHT